MKASVSFNIAKYIVEREHGKITVFNIRKLKWIILDIMRNSHGADYEHAYELCEAFRNRVFYEHAKDRETIILNPNIK